jgi:hypothetical protein
MEPRSHILKIQRAKGGTAIALTTLFLALTAAGGEHETQATMLDHRAAWAQALLKQAESDKATQPPRHLRIRLERFFRVYGALVRPGRDQSGIIDETGVLHVNHRANHWGPVQLGGLSDKGQGQVWLREADFSSVAVGENGLSGLLKLHTGRFQFRSDVAFGLMLHHTPPELKPVTGWALDSRDEIKGKPQSVRLDPEPSTPGWWLTLEIPNGFQPKPGEFRPLTLEYFRSGSAQDGFALAPRYNRAAHLVEATQWEASADRVRASLVVTINRDRWVGANGVQTFTFELPVRQGKLEGAFKSEGVFGSYSGELQGTLFETREGTWTVQDGQTARTGHVVTAWAPALKRADGVEALTNPAPDRAPSLASVHELQRDLAALADALRRPDTSFQENRERQRFPIPIQGEASALTSALAELVQGASAEFQAAQPSQDPYFGPYASEARALPVEDGVHALPAKIPANEPAKWEYVTHWRALGGFRLDLEEATSGFPPVVPVDGLVVRAEDAVTGEPAWTTHTAKTPLFLPPEIRQQTQAAKVEDFYWYAAAVLDAPEATEVWLATPAYLHGAVWVNHNRVWTSAGRGDGLDRAVFKTSLRKGRNVVLLKATADHMSWASHQSRIGNGPEKIQLARAGLWVCVAGAPSQGAQGLKVHDTPSQPGTPPVAFDLDSGAEKGFNIAWQIPLTSLQADPVALEDRVYLLGKHATWGKVGTSSGPARTAYGSRRVGRPGILAQTAPSAGKHPCQPQVPTGAATPPSARAAYSSPCPKPPISLRFRS